MAKNTSGLEKSRSERSQNVVERMHNAIDQLKASRKPINPTSVAKLAKVSRTTVYEHAEVSERIEAFKLAKKRKSQDIVKKDDYDKVKEQHKKIKDFEKDIEIAMLRLVEMEELKRANQELTAANERLQSQVTELEIELLTLKNGDLTSDKIVSLKRESKKSTKNARH